MKITIMANTGGLPSTNGDWTATFNNEKTGDIGSASGLIGAACFTKLFWDAVGGMPGAYRKTERSG